MAWHYLWMNTWGRRLATGALFTIGVVASIATEPGQVDLCQTSGDVQRCNDSCEQLAAVMRQPLTPPASTTGRCVAFNGRVGCGCFVEDERDPSALRGAELRLPADSFVDDGPCSVFGRLGECLFDPATFPGCTLPIDQGGVIDDEGSDAVCADVCATVDERRRAAAAPRLNVSVSDARCDFECSCQLRDGDACGIADRVVPLPAGTTTDEANALVQFRPCDGGQQ